MDLNREQLWHALEVLDRQLANAGIATELRVVGGAAMSLMYDSARTTSDIDSVFDNYDDVRSAVEAAALELNLPTSWVNSQISGLALPFEKDHEARKLVVGDHLTVRISSPQFLLYTKIISQRQAEQDFEDALKLARYLGLETVEDIETTVKEFGSVDGSLELYLEDIAREI